MIINSYYESSREGDLKTAGLKMQEKLLELKAAGTDKAMYTNEEVINAIPEVAALLPLTPGEIHFMCEIAGVEYEQE